MVFFRLKYFIIYILLIYRIKRDINLFNLLTLFVYKQKKTPFNILKRSLLNKFLSNKTVSAEPRLSNYTYVLFY